MGFCLIFPFHLNDAVEIYLYIFYFFFPKQNIGGCRCITYLYPEKWFKVIRKDRYFSTCRSEQVLKEN